MRGMRIRPRARHALAWMLALLLVAGLMPVLPEVPKAFAEEADAIMPGNDVVDEGVPVEGDADATELGVAATAEGAEELGDTELSVVGERGEALVLDKVAEDAPPDQLKLVSNDDTVTVEGPALQAQSVNVSNPRVRVDSSMESGQVATWDCVWFGSYPQTEVAPTDAAYASLQSASWDSNGDATVDGKRYRRISQSDASYSGYWADDGYGSVTYRYFRYEPIKWRVLEVSGSKAFVVSDVALDTQMYNEYNTDVTWENSSIRSWLNGYGSTSNQLEIDYYGEGFLNGAFSPAERTAILETDVTNGDDASGSGQVDGDTVDRVFLLSKSEACDASYGFVDNYSTDDEGRCCKPSDFACAMGAWRPIGGCYEGNCDWFTRSTGDLDLFATYVNHGGRVEGRCFVYSCDAVRPALSLSLSSPYVQAAGMVNSNGNVDEHATAGIGNDTGDEETDNSDTGEEQDPVDTDGTGPHVKTDTSLIAGRVATWDCVWFGSYPQTEVKPGDSAYASLQSASWDSNGNATVCGTRYCRVVRSGAKHNYVPDDDNDPADRYFRYEPIKWRVLKISGGKALVIADVSLDAQAYNVRWENGDVTWETSSIRSWLNGYGSSSNRSDIDYSDRSFLSTAFSASEKSAILATDVASAGNTYWGTPGGNETKDWLFLLSETEANDTSYGFDVRFGIFDEARRCKVSDYAQARGAWESTDKGIEGNCCWWLRSIGLNNYATFVDYCGNVYRYSNYAPGCGVRPAMNLDLSSPHIQAAGTVSSNGDVNELAPKSKDISSVILGTTSYTYDGVAKKPVATAKAGDVVVPASGYTVSYKNNVNAGTATVTVTGKGDYAGSAKATFKIAAASLSKAKVTGVKGKTYTGKALTQAPTVKVGSRTLKKGADFALAYKSNVKAGTATMTVTGKGNYKGAKSVSFTIAKAANPMALKAVAHTAKLATVKKKAVTVAAPLKFTKKAQGKVTYAKVAKGSSAALTVNKSTGKVTVKKGAKKGTYKVKIKVTAAGNSNYKALSKTITCKVVVK